MPEVEKVISFRVEDKGSSNIDRLRTRVERLRDSILENALKFSEASSDTVQQIEAQTKAIERRQRLETSVGVERVRGRVRGQVAAAEERFERFRVSPAARAGGAAGIEVEKGKMEDTIKNLEAAMKEEIAQEQRGTDLQLQMLRELIETIKETSREELREDKTGTQETVRAYQRGELEDATQTVKAKAKIQADELEREAEVKKKEGPGFVAGIVGGAAIATILQGISRVGGALAGAQTEEQVLAEGLKGIPIVGGFLGTAYGRAVEAEEAAERGRLRLGAITGRREGFISAAEFGFDITETLPVAQMLARGRGFRGNITGDTRDILATEKAFGLDRNTLMNMARMGGFDVGGGGAGESVRRLIAELGLGQPGADFSNLANSNEAMVALLQDQSSTLESIDSNSAAQTIATFTRIGGSFADPRAKERILQINRAIAKPNNQYQQALNFATLSQLDPSASYYELREMEETGITQKGFMSSLLKNYESMYGSGELAMEAVRQRFGLSFAQGRTLWEGYQADKTVFDAISSEGQLKEQLAKQDVSILAAKRTADLEKSQAEITNAFVEGMGPGLLKVGELTGIRMGEAIKETLDIEVFGVEMGEKIGQGIINIFSGGGNLVND